MGPHEDYKPSAQQVCFTHRTLPIWMKHVLVQYRNRMSWKDEHIVPFTHLDLEILTDQTLVVLKLRTVDITMGALMGLVHGDGTKKRLAQCRLNLVDANINAWSCLLNSLEWKELTKERLKLVSALAELEPDKHHQKGSKPRKEGKGQTRQGRQGTARSQSESIKVHPSPSKGGD
jgi:hypothetical protein